MYFLYVLKTLRNTWLLLELYRDVLHINIWDEFDADLAVTILIFQIRSSSTNFVIKVRLPVSVIIFHEQGCSQTYFHQRKCSYEAENIYLLFLWSTLLFYSGPFQPLTDHMQMSISHISELCRLEGSQKNIFSLLASHMKPNPDCAIARSYTKTSISCTCITVVRTCSSGTPLRPHNSNI